MNEVTSQLYVGDIQQAGRPQAYRRNDIDVVVQLTHSSPDDGYPDGVAVHHHAMRDGPQNDSTRMVEAASKTVSVLEREHRVLVHCSAGASRSIAVVTAALAIHEDVSFESAFDRVRAARQVQVHPAVYEHAEAAVQQIRSE
jgi:atypical dual specificity phosphatase